MSFTPVGNTLSPTRKRDKTPAGSLFFWLVTLLLGLILYVFWEPLRQYGIYSQPSALPLHRVGLFFRAFTFLGDDYFSCCFFA